MRLKSALDADQPMLQLTRIQFTVTTVKQFYVLSIKINQNYRIENIILQL